MAAWGGWIIGLLGFGSVALFIWWLVQQGKLLQQGKYNKELSKLKDEEAKDIAIWIKGEGELDNEAIELKARHHARPADLGTVVDVLRRAHGPRKVRPTRKSGTTP